MSRFDWSSISLDLMIPTVLFPFLATGTGVFAFARVGELDDTTQRLVDYDIETFYLAALDAP